jgi:hypothetical protein
MMTNVNDNVAAPARTTVRIPDALTALARRVRKLRQGL